MRRVRQGNTAGNTNQGNTNQGNTQKIGEDNVLPEMVPALGSLPERPRYLKLSDGQVLDRANPPKGKPGWNKVEALRRCNRANETVIDPVRAERYRRWRAGIIESPVAGSMIDNRKDLMSIVQSLKERKVIEYVSLGMMPMTVVADLLECTG